MYNVLRFAFVLCMAVTAPAIAHHSFSEFDQRRLIEVSGTLTEVAWQNPHVRLRLKAVEAGKTVTWDIECHSVGILTRFGFDPTALKVGDKVTVAGNPSRVSPIRMFGTNLLPPSRREIVMAPNIKNHWPQSAVGGREVPKVTQMASSAQPPPTGLFKVWGSGFVDPETSPAFLWSGSMSLTPAAREALAKWDPLHDTITRGCDPKGMPTIMEQPYGMAFEDHGDQILLRIEEYDTVRAIRMSDAKQGKHEKSLLGYSSGKWEGQALVVTTTNISWPYIHGNGLRQGPSSRLEERFEPSADGRRLSYTLTVTDPDTFTTPAVLHRAWVWSAEERVRPYSCGKPQAVN